MFNETEYGPGSISVVGRQELSVPLVPTGPHVHDQMPAQGSSLAPAEERRKYRASELRKGLSVTGWRLGKPSLNLRLEYLRRTKEMVRCRSHAW